jgi:outer membrane lipoprotein
MKLKLAVAGAALLALSACATLPPEPLRGEYTKITPAEAQSKDYTDATTVWGGVIAKTTPMQGQTCFEVVSTPLDSQLRPRELREESAGRFMACRAGFYDPAVFAMNREVTFVGRVNGYSDQKIGDYTYRYPKMDAQTIYLWGKRDRYATPPYGSPYGYYGSWGWGLGYGWPWW